MCNSKIYRITWKTDRSTKTTKNFSEINKIPKKINVKMFSVYKLSKK